MAQLTPPQTPQTPLPTYENFTVYSGTQSYTFEEDVFMKMSKKCARLIKDGIYEGTIEQQVLPETFEAFVKACTLQPFKVTSQNAFELKKIAEDWEINSLAKFVNDYIDKKKLEPPPEVDFLGILIDHLKNQIDEPEDITNVALYVNSAIRDERFESLPPEIIFKIVNSADPDQVDMPLLANFTLRLFETKPTSVVPLVLLLDFDRLTKEERDQIFQNKNVHELNLGYFIIQAFSSARNKSDRDIAQAKSDLEDRLNTLRENVKSEQEATFQKAKSEQDDNLSNLRERLDVMAEQLKELEEKSEEQRKGVEEAAQNHDQKFAEMNGILNQMDQLIQKRNQEAAGQSEHVAEEVSQQMDQLRDEMDTKVKQAKTADAERCAKLEIDSKDLIDKQQKRLKELKRTADELVDMLNDTNAHIYDLKAKLAAKIVRDRLRYDKFLRKTDNRFDLFNKSPGLWELKEKDVQLGEDFIGKIEEQVDKYCPIRGKADQS